MPPGAIPPGTNGFKGPSFSKILAGKSSKATLKKLLKRLISLNKGKPRNEKTVIDCPPAFPDRLFSEDPIKAVDEMEFMLELAQVSANISRKFPLQISSFLHS